MQNHKTAFSAQFAGEEGKKKLFSLIVSAIFVVLAIVVFCCTGNEKLVSLSRTMLVIIGILMLVAAAEIFALHFLFGEEVPNFFLYDAARGVNLGKEELSFSLVNRRMDDYVAHIARNKGQLWLPDYLGQCDFGENRVFAPAVSYKMLIDLATENSDAGWRCFCAARPATVRQVADALIEADPNLARDLLRIKELSGTDPEKIRGFLLRNAKYLEGRLTRYVVENLSAFDGIIL